MFRFGAILLAPVLAAAQAVPLTTCDRDRAALLRGQGHDAIVSGSFATAADLLEKARAACPALPGIGLELAQAQLGKRDFAGAVRSAEEYVAVHPDAIDGRIVLAQALFLSQRLSEARQEADRVLAAQPANGAALKIKANCAYLIGDFQTAKNAMVKVLEARPDDEDASYMLGRMYYQEDYVDLAIGQFQRVLKVNPKAYKAWDNLGLCYQALGDVDAATRHFLTAIKLVEKDHPEYDWPYANLAELLLKTGQPQKAYDAAAIAAKRNPYSARDFFIGAKALDQLGKSELALNWLQRSAALDPAYPEPWYLLARVYRRLGNTEKSDEARKKFDELKAKAPKKRR